MVDVSYEKEFVFHDGRRAESLSELYRIVCTLSDDAFYAFVTAQKNDFANWIEFVLCDCELAKKIRSVRFREEIARIIEQQLRELVAQESFVRITKKEFAMSSPTTPSTPEPTIILSAVHVSTPTPTKASSTFAQAPSISPISTPAPLPAANTTLHPADNKWYDFFIKRESSDREIFPLKKDAEKPAKNNWYEFFVRKRSSEIALDAVKANAAAGPVKEESVADASVLPHSKHVNHFECRFWITLYTILIIAIVGILVYIHFFK